MAEISLFLAFSAGLLSFLSPCVLPLVPAYLTYLTGETIDEIKANKSRVTVLSKAVGFTIGFSVVFILMFISISTVGWFFKSHQNILRKIGGVIIIIFGLHTMGIFKVKFLYYEKRAVDIDKIRGSLSSIFMGMAFAAGWTPCVGPILASILIYAQSADTLSKGVTLLGAYSLGLAIPFLLAAYLIKTFSEYIKKLYKYFSLISIISGLILISMGILTFTGTINILSRYL